MRLSFITATGILAATIASAQNGFSGPGLYEIMNRKSTRMMALDLQDRTSVIQIVSRSQEEQRWVVEPAPGGAFLIRSAVNGKALQITNNARSAPVICARFDQNPAQLWRLEPVKDGDVIIASAAGGRVLDIPNGSNKEGLHIQIYDRDGDPNQLFVFHRIDERSHFDRERRLHWDK